MKNNYAIILASGSGNRSGLNYPKQFLKIAGRSVLEHALLAFENHKDIKGIVLVSSFEYVPLCENIIEKAGLLKVIKVLSGGENRQESSFIGLSAIPESNVNVLIHDAVRPFLVSNIISDCINALKTYKAVDVAVKSSDTLVQINSQDEIENIPNRELFRRGQTPQCFDLELILDVHNQARKLNDFTVTDDCGLIMKYSNEKVIVINGDEFNSKITTPVDVAIADKLFQLKTITNMSHDLTNLKNKVIIIFGSSKGIGEAMFNSAKAYGAKVYGFSPSNGCDITDYEKVKQSIKDVYDKENRIDAVIVTAGVLNTGYLISRTMEEIETEIRINYLGSVNIAKESYTYLKESAGHLVFFTSSSYTRGRMNYSTYSSIKAALVNLTQALAEEWFKNDVKVNIINPERTATPMRFKNFGKEPEETLLQPEFVADKALMVLLDNVTGQVIDVKKD